MEEWLEEYQQLMFHSGNTIEAMAKASVMKFEHMPDRLYKYRMFCPNHIKALNEGVLYSASMDSLNDIKELNIVITEKAKETLQQRTYDDIREQHGFPVAEVKTPSEFLRIIDAYYKSIANTYGRSRALSEEAISSMIHEMEEAYERQIQTIIEADRKMYSICSLSATNASNRMWGYYADSHQGFCIEYDFKSLGIDNLKTAFLFPVVYEDDSRVFVDDIDHIDGNIGMIAATRKETKWAYEQEWRLLFPGKVGGRPQPMPKPTAIYIGERTNEANTKIMLEFCKAEMIPLYRMKYYQHEDLMKSQIVQFS